jgi:hypothetical protein
VIAVGTAVLVGIPAVLATLHAADSQFRWWWPTNWMAVPSVIFLAGCLLVAVPVRRSPLPGDDRVGAAVRPAGRPLDEVMDPFALEVHRPVQPEDAPAGLPALPAYVPREHDMELGRVARGAAEGSSGIAVLVGGSSTGKTRACWEALQLLRDRPGQWRLWHPIDPSRPDAALRELPAIGPRTVVWLNEAQFYLDVVDGGLGERVAAGLRELLRDPARGPVLVLATLWPQFWDGLTSRPAGGADPHAQARELLVGHDITVPAAFTAAQLQRLGEAGDARLVLAAGSAPDGEVIQFLAGAPELLARYRNAPLAAAALIHAAMDARRLGMGPALPQAFLEAAAPGYLTGTEWDALGEDWLEQALAYAAAPCKGVPGPLTRIRSRPGTTRSVAPSGGTASHVSGEDEPLYRLADYLEQLGRRERGGVYPPESLWATFTTTGEPDLLRQLGKQAEDRGRFQHAVRLYIQAADRDAAARHALARLREQAGASAAEALDRLARRDTYAGEVEYVAGAVELALDRQDADRIRLGTSALHDLAARQEQAGDNEEAAALYQQAADRGDTGALCALARLREQAGDGEGAKAWAVQAAARGDTSALDDLAGRRESAGNRVEAEALAVLAADYGNTETLWMLAWLRERAGDAEAAEALAVQVADRGGNAAVLSALAWMRELAGDTDSAEALHRQGADRGRTGSMRDLARLRHRAGYTDDADALYREAIDCGDSNALLGLAELRESVGDSVGAGRLLRFGLTGDGKIATMLDFASYGGLVGSSGVLTV